jgi:hypothetical protein
MAKRLLIIVTFLVLLGTGVALALSTPEIDRWVIASGGGTVQSPGGEIVLQGTIGQPILGSSQEGGVEICSGFWCRVGEFFKVFLPITLR